MIKKQVTSSNISHIGHDGTTTLFIRFHSGKTYEYPAPMAIYALLAEAESVGKAFHQHVRKAFDGKPVEEACPFTGAA